jgi:hypothetical protein
MNQWTALAKLQAESGKREDRKHPRFVANQLNCTKGIVADFSATGLRICYRKDMKFVNGDFVFLELCSPKGVIRCECQVVWTKRASRRQFEVGFRFTDPDIHKSIRLFDCGFDPLGEGLLDR